MHNHNVPLPVADLEGAEPVATPLPLGEGRT